MPHHLTDEEIVQYRSGALLAAELLAADDHLAVCAECRARLAAAPALARWAHSLRDEEAPGGKHLDYWQLAAKADRSLAAGEAFEVEAHLRDCAECRAEYEDLAGFRDRIQPVRVRPLWRRPAVWGAIAAAMVLCAGLWFASLRPSRNEPALTASLRDAGGVIGLDASGGLRVPASIPSEDRSLLLETLRQGALPGSSVPPEFQSQSGALLRGQASEQAFTLLQPVARMVLSDRPEFRWQELAGAGGYRVEVFDTAFHRVAGSGSLKTASWTPEQPLPRGQSYLWQVTAERNGLTVRAPQPPAPEARFRVLDADTAGRLQRLQAQQPLSHLLMAAAYAQAGLREEAQSQLTELRRENPDSPLAERLAAGR